MSKIKAHSRHRESPAEAVPALLAQLPVEPVSRRFGFDRGTPVDRYYIERFLSRHSECIRGHVLEVADNTYTRQFGHGVEMSEVLHATGEIGGATIVGDLCRHESLPHGVIDCFICTQTLHVIYDLNLAVRGASRLLRPGGVLLATLPGISQVSRYDMDRWGDFWRLTQAAAMRLFGDVFGQNNVMIETYGNVAAACAFLQGLAAEELRAGQLDHQDSDYPVVIAVKATRESDANH